MMNDYLDELNESQRAAVLYNDGKMADMETKTISINPSSSGTENIIFNILREPLTAVLNLWCGRVFR